jgi:hypothetical protein
VSRRDPEDFRAEKLGYLFVRLSVTAETMKRRRTHNMNRRLASREITLHVSDGTKWTIRPQDEPALREWIERRGYLVVAREPVSDGEAEGERSPLKSGSSKEPTSDAR